MEQFIRRQNIEHYCRLLEQVTDADERRTIIKLLAEERQKLQETHQPAK